MRHVDQQNTSSSSLAGQELPSRPGSINFAGVRELITMRQVLDVLNWQHAAKHGAQLRGPCPIHKSENPSSRSFSVNLEKHVYHCFAACCGSKGNQLDLFAAVTGQRPYDAALDLCQRLGIDIPRPETTRNEHGSQFGAKHAKMSQMQP
jgi:DNA primase